VNPRLAALVTAALLGLVAAAPAHGQTRACNPGELGDARTPAEIDGESVGRVDRALVAGHKYSIALVIENAIGQYPDSSPYRQSSAKEGSIAVTGPAGVTLTPRPETDSFRGGYEFTTPRGPKSLTFTVTWIQQLQARSGASAGECAASATITLPVFTLQLSRVTNVRFFPHRVARVVGGFAVSDDFFQLVVRDAAEPKDPAPVYVVVRVRTGRAVAPSARSKVFRRVRLSRLHTISKGGMSVDDATIDGPNDTFLTGVTVSLNSFVGQGRTVRFGFSIAIEQAGRVLGGMRGGAVCRIRFLSRANRHYRACSPHGFAKHP
jgi:hypothetical protein